MLTSSQIVLSCCVLMFVASAYARPQVWNIGFVPNVERTRNPFLPDGNSSQLVDPNDNAISTTAAPVQSTTPSRAFYDCLSRCPSTSEYNPICGSDSQNYHNLARLECSARCGANVSAVRRGTCQPL